MKELRFIDLFAGIGGFHVALSRLGHKCVFASELDPELRSLYESNFPKMKGKIFGDIREFKDKIPAHDFLCAGFPCQPFSKSGAQLGTKDKTRGTLFHEILEILKKWQPKYVLLENVGNFGRHDGGRTWSIVKESLRELGYFVAGTEHVTKTPHTDWRDRGAGLRTKLRTPVPHEVGDGLISPHQFGFPHHRERFFIYASLDPLPDRPFPAIDRGIDASISQIVQTRSELSALDEEETKLSTQQVDCIEHWNRLRKALPAGKFFPSFPIWGDELSATYPYESRTPWATRTGELGKSFVPPYPPYTHKEEMLEALPNYAREEVEEFRRWKIHLISRNRQWWRDMESILPSKWSEELFSYPPSLRKLEWNAKEELNDIWSYILQFRPSGLRVRRYKTSPALVAMTGTQIPILGPERRFLSRVEGKLLQGLDASHQLPKARRHAFKALGNAVHAGVIEILARNLVEVTEQSRKSSKGSERLVA